MNAGRANRSVTERAQRVANNAGFGVWERSLRINRDDDASWKTTGILALFVAPWPFVAMAILMPEPWWGKIFTITVGFAVLVFGLLMFAIAVWRWQTGIALAHFFEAGLVLERTKGEILALHYDCTRPDYLMWTESTNDSPRTRVQLWIATGHDQVAVISAGIEAELEDASWIAERLGLAGTPRQIKEPWDVPAVW